MQNEPKNFIVAGVLFLVVCGFLTWNIVDNSNDTLRTVQSSVKGCTVTESRRGGRVYEFDLTEPPRSIRYKPERLERPAIEKACQAGDLMTFSYVARGGIQGEVRWAHAIGYASPQRWIISPEQAAAAVAREMRNEMLGIGILIPLAIGCIAWGVRLQRRESRPVPIITESSGG